MLATTTATKPFQAATAASRQPARQCRRHTPVAAAAGPQPKGATESGAAAGVDRRTLLLSAGAVLAGAALQQSQQAAAEEACEYKTAPSGLQWCELAEGSGESPVAGAMIRAHYSGKLASNGVVFDSSYERGRPLNFKVGAGQVIAGWDMGILGADGIPPMKEGGKRRLQIPAELAYGSRGAGGVIPPNSVLIFDVEYLGRYGKR